MKIPCHDYHVQHNCDSRCYSNNHITLNIHIKVKLARNQLVFGVFGKRISFVIDKVLFDLTLKHTGISLTIRFVRKQILFCEKKKKPLKINHQEWINK